MFLGSVILLKDNEQLIFYLLDNLSKKPHNYMFK